VTNSLPLPLSWFSNGRPCARPTRWNASTRSFAAAPNQASLPNEEVVLLLLFGLLRSGQVKLRRLVGWHDLTINPPSEAVHELGISTAQLAAVIRWPLLFPPTHRNHHLASGRVRPMCVRTAVTLSPGAVLTYNRSLATTIVCRASRLQTDSKRGCIDDR
jgi:hypothetical protein